MADVPETLSQIIPLPEPKPGQWSRRNRRARSNIPGRRANTLPPLPPPLPQEKIFRINPDSEIGRATLRKWGRSRGYKIAGRGKIPARVREAFMKENNIWTVREFYLHSRGPGGKRYVSRNYQLRQGEYLVPLLHGKPETIDPFYIKRALGDELFNLLQEVKQ